MRLCQVQDQFVLLGRELIRKRDRTSVIETKLQYLRKWASTEISNMCLRIFKFVFIWAINKYINFVGFKISKEIETNIALNFKFN